MIGSAGERDASPPCTKVSAQHKRARADRPPGRHVGHVVLGRDSVSQCARTSCLFKWMRRIRGRTQVPTYLPRGLQYEQPAVRPCGGGPCCPLPAGWAPPRIVGSQLYKWCV